MLARQLQTKMEERVESSRVPVVMLRMNEKKGKRVKSHPNFFQRQEWFGNVIPDDKI